MAGELTAMGIRAADQRGMTILEVLIAFMILSFAVSGILRLMLAGDRIAARGSILSSATILAWNQVETIREAEHGSRPIGDTLYSATLNNADFEVSRSRIRSACIDSTGRFGEYSVTVSRKEDKKIALVSLHLLQGFSRGGR